jgi:hypothetical protein
MSLYKDASLVMIPSAVKDGKLYSIRPTDGDGDFTFSRGSNLAATRVDVNGLIEKGRENLLLQSNQFDTTWNSANNTLVSGQSGYDGSNNAWFVTKIPASYVPLTQAVSVSGINTFSFYAKAGTAAFVRTYVPNGNWIINFDFASGVATRVGSSVDLISYSMTSVGNGWYRCSSTHNGSMTDMRIYNEWDETNASTYYLQDVQLESGLVATDYIETGASTAQAGILEDLPRLDYSGGASCPSLLLEPQRTNKVLYSEYLDNTTNTISGLSISQNQTISPEGVNNAAKIIEDNTSTIHRFGYSFPADTMSASWYAKAGERNKIAVFTPPADVGYDLTGEGSIINLGYSTAGASIESVGNGWYRCQYTFTFGSNAGVYIGLVNDSNQISYLGDGSSGAYIYGWQVESGSYPTSYIPTMGSAVTRSADIGISDVDSLLTSNATYTWMVEFIVPEVGNGGGEITFKNTSGSSQLRVYCNQNNMVGLRVDESSQNYYIPASVGDTAKCLFQCSSGLVKGFYNGALVKTFTIDTGMDAQRIHLGPPVAAPEVKQVLLFNTALTDSECIALTTL